MKKVLFVCLGNICRSPLGEAIFNSKVKELGYAWVSDSAGTAAYHIGKNPDPRSIAVVLAHNIPIKHKARQFVKEDIEAFDYVLAMDQSNFNDMKQTIGGDRENLFLLREFDSLAMGDLDVPDPYYGGDEGFEEVFQMVSRSVDELINKMVEEL